MKCCYICRWYTKTLDDGLPMCGRLREIPLDPPVLKTSASLKLAGCYQGGGQKYRAGTCTFSRIEVRPSREGDEIVLYCCCPGFLDVLSKGYLTCSIPDMENPGKVEFTMGVLVVHHCPVCGDKLQTVAQVAAHTKKMRAARRKPSGKTRKKGSGSK